jgi:hypothetical protein
MLMSISDACSKTIVHANMDSHSLPVTYLGLGPRMPRSSAPYGFAC